MTHHIGYIHAVKQKPFSPPSSCRSGARLEEYTYYYQKGYRQVTGRKPYIPTQESQPIAA